MSDTIQERLRRVVFYGSGCEDLSGKAADEIDRLRAELDEAKVALPESCGDCRFCVDPEDMIPGCDSPIGAKHGHIFTTEQINAAWEYATHPSVDPDAIRALNRMGIVACDHCYDSMEDPGWVFKMDVTTGGDFYKCEHCNGRGWVMGER